MTLRWSDFVLGSDGESLTADGLLDLAAKDRDVEVILGAGFDPRALVGLSRILAITGGKRMDVLRIDIPGSTSDQRTLELAAKNEAEIERITKAVHVRVTDLPFPTVEEPRSAGIRIARQVVEREREPDGLIVVDISGLPSSIYFPVIGALLEAAAETRSRGELVVAVCENPQVDDAIVEEGVSDAGPIGGFKNGLDLETGADGTRVWAPVMGSGREAALLAVYQRLDAREICPVFPFPARNPRRADDLLIEYHDLLFGQFGVEPRNFIYADERNPFDVYRALSRLHSRYGEALEPLGPSKLVISPHSSKILAVGVLLAAYEHDLPVVSAVPSEYSVRVDVDLDVMTLGNTLTAAWIAGEPYRVQPPP